MPGRVILRAVLSRRISENRPSGSREAREGSAFNDLWDSTGAENCSPCRRHTFTSDRNSQQGIFCELYRRHRLSGTP